jgi:hypothetical protein
MALEREAAPEQGGSKVGLRRTVNESDTDGRNDSPEDLC